MLREPLAAFSLLAEFVDVAAFPGLEQDEVASAFRPEGHRAGGQSTVRGRVVDFRVSQVVGNGLPVALFWEGRFEDPLFGIRNILDLGRRNDWRVFVPKWHLDGGNIAKISAIY